MQEEEAKNEIMSEMFVMGYKGKNVKVMHEIARAEQDVYVVKFDPTDQFIAVGYGDGKIRIYFTGDGELKIEINANNMGMDGYDERPITNLRWKS